MHGQLSMAGAVLHRRAALQLQLQAFSVLVVAASLAADHHIQCPSFSCGDQRDVSLPFRRRGDPPGCGSPSYELECSDTKATIRIGGGTYHVKSIDNIDQYLWVVDSSLTLDSSNSSSDCPPLPRWDQLPFKDRLGDDSPHSAQVELAPDEGWFATFVNCSQKIIDSNYVLVPCLSTINSSFVYVLTGRGSYFTENLDPSCGYLAMTPTDMGGQKNWYWGTAAVRLENVSYEDVFRSMRNGFAVQFPFRYSSTQSFINCVMDLISDNSGEQITGNRFVDISISIDSYFSICMRRAAQLPFYYTVLLALMRHYSTVQNILECRFILTFLVVLIFLAHKYWKTRIRIDAVEKFLRMQQMLGPTRYAYTDITAITRHFRDKLGQGGYGSVYKGVLLPGDVHVAVKMLNCNPNCNGEEFISEVSTIGRIHHVNVVCLVGFCSEEMRRALVYEYMPRGSLDKYIFSSEKSFSWDKLNQIALGIARGIDYLHQGCDMQILHFDIKPHNILLDDNFVPKVADFGLARLYPRGTSFVSERALRGTIGYIAPEMISRSFGVISSKSDVYSFGMLLLEMAGGRKNADPDTVNSSQAYYPSRVYSQLARQETAGEITDVVEMHELEKKLCIVGLWCIQMKSCDRPTMSEVIEMLERGVDVLELPARPFFCDDEHIPAMDSYHITSEITAISEEEDGSICASRCEV